MALRHKARFVEQVVCGQKYFPMDMPDAWTKDEGRRTKDLIGIPRPFVFRLSSFIFGAKRSIQSRVIEPVAIALVETDDDVERRGIRATRLEVGCLKIGIDLAGAAGGLAHATFEKIPRERGLGQH